MRSPRDRNMAWDSEASLLPPPASFCGTRLYEEAMVVARKQEKKVKEDWIVWAPANK
jgi:hypothetical protein